MIDQNLIQIISRKQQTTELNVRREYVQQLFLSYFYQQPVTNKIFFKGGTALRIIYGSPRFSEDLDFSSSLTDIKKIESAALETLKEIEREGIKTGIVESKLTSGGYLGIFSFKLTAEKIILQVEISFKEKEINGEIMTAVSNLISGYTLMILKQDQLVEQKIKALLVRQKPRDFYDLYFILRANLLSVTGRKILNQVLKKLKKTTINFSRELKIFLPKNQWQIIKNFKASLEREIYRFNGGTEI